MKIHLIEDILQDELTGWIKNHFWEFSNYCLIALTPTACYQLDRMNLKYSIPEDYCYPKRIDVRKAFGEYKNKSKVFVKSLALSFLEREETDKYWGEFVDSLVRSYGKNVEFLYWGNTLALKVIVGRRAKQ